MLQFNRFALGLSYAINILLLFLLLFEERVQLPAFLQVAGRTHPLVLHFPLTLLFVGIFLEFLITRRDFRQPATEKITSVIFYTFALSSAFAALFGLFLYKEGSYLGREVALHKWFGVGVSLLALLIIRLKETANRTYYYITLGLSAACLLVAGHFGAEVTHGNGFLTEPLKKQRSRITQIENADSAIVFRDVVQPILNEKCVNCHNLNRAKGDLILSDYESIINGGETKNGLIAGNAERSLLYKYIVLPMEDSLHMPPKDKLQLDQEEIRLIGWWINAGAPADTKYVHLPKVDSIQPLMLARFHPKTGLDLLDIPFVDYEVVRRLNNPYRTVQQISATRPYIAVFLGTKKDFSAKDLTELDKVARQVVSIDLGNSAVKDDDLKSIAPFTHVQKLFLQNTVVGDEGVKHLKGLRYLDVLNLSGTKITQKTLEEVSRWENLKKLYLYNTSITEESVVALNQSHPQLEVYSTQIDLSDSVYNAELTPPVVKIDSSFFRISAQVDVKLSRGKVKYYYTQDGTDPTPESASYTEPFKINQSGELRMKATMTGWKDSKVVEFPLLKLGIRPRVVTLETKPDPKHSGKLDSALVDGQAGGFSRGDKAYLGYTDTDMQVLFELANPVSVSQVALSLLEDVNSGTLAPEDMEVWIGIEKSRLTRIATVESVMPADNAPMARRVIKITFPAQSAQFIRLKAKRVKTLPAWHPLHKTGKGSLFVDEVSIE